MASVLVVEDDRDLRMLYRTALTLAGYSVIAVEDGIDALRRIDEHGAPTVMVLDLGLPRLGGRDVYHELRAHAQTKNVPVVIVTGDASNLGPTDFACVVLEKPIRAEAVVEAVDRCLQDALDRGN